MLALATCGFIEKRANIFFIGQPGTGKTHLSIALALEALKFGKTVLFTTVWDMITMLQQSRADYSYQKRLQWYTKPDLLILDELGYRSLDKTTGEDFYEIVSRRYEKGSIIITTNRSIPEWPHRRDGAMRRHRRRFTGALLLFLSSALALWCPNAP